VSSPPTAGAGSRIPVWGSFLIMTADRPRVVVTHWVHPEVIAFLAGFSEPVAPDRGTGVWPAARVLELAAGAAGLVACMADRVDGAFLDRCPRLRVVAATLKGYDSFDAAACAARGVWLTTVPDTIIAPTAELAVGLVLGITRRVGEGDRAVRAGTFAGWRPRLYGTGLAGAAVGIVGMGELGRAIAERLRAFGPRIRYCDPQPLPAAAEARLAVARCGLEDLVAASDVIVAAAPLTAGTAGLLGRDLLRRARPGACVVNVGRGSVVDEEAVADALADGRLGGYAADVFAMEDWAWPGRPPRIPARLLAHPRTLFTPHLGAAVGEVRREMSLQAARSVRQALGGERPDYAVAGPAGDPPGAGAP
jgi:phosphonate dehydrogenase